LSCLNLVHYLDAARLELGGVVRAVLDMAQVMADAGHQVRLLTPDASDVPDAWRSGEPGQPRAIVVPAPRFGRRVPAVIDEAIQSADVLHLHGPWTLANPPIAAAARHHRCPYVVTLHGMLDDWSMKQRGLKKRAYLKLTGRRLLEKAAGIQCTAEAERQQSQPWYPRGRSVVLPYIFNTDPYQQLPGPQLAEEKIAALSNDRFKVLFLSRIHPKKGIEHLIDAASLLVKNGSSFRVLVTGPDEPGYQAVLEERIQRHGLTDTVVFTGPVYGQTKSSLYQAADVFVLPTSQENFGIVLTEALACGTPVITTRGTDIWAEIQEAGGIIVPQDAQAIAKAIQDLIEDPARCTDLGEQGRQWVLKRFESHRLRIDYEAMYRAALANQA